MCACVYKTPWGFAKTPLYRALYTHMHISVIFLLTLCCPWFITEMWLKTHNIYWILKHIFMLEEIDAMCKKSRKPIYIYIYIYVYIAPNLPRPIEQWNGAAVLKAKWMIIQHPPFLANLGNMLTLMYGVCIRLTVLYLGVTLTNDETVQGHSGLEVSSHGP